MFGVLDLITVLIIEDKLKFYINNVEFLEQILCGYHNKRMFNLVGAEYIRDSIEFLRNQKIFVQPYYNPDSRKLPQISVIASGEENQQYIGDHGYSSLAKKQTFKSNSLTVATWTAVSIDGDTMTVPKELSLETKLWPGVYVTNGTHKVVLRGIDDKASRLYFESELPDNLSPEGWRAETAGSNRVCELNSSTDAVTVQCKLTTHGEPSQHRLIGILLRAILKSSRLAFDYYGFQNTKIGWSPMVLTDQDEMVFESVYSISGVYTDHWIDRIGQTADKASNIDVSVEVCNSDPDGVVKL